MGRRPPTGFCRAGIEGGELGLDELLVCFGERFGLLDISGEQDSNSRTSAIEDIWLNYLLCSDKIALFKISIDRVL